MAKILHIITRLDMGGSAENTVATVIHLAQKGHQVTLATGPSRDFSPDITKRILNAKVEYVLIKNLVRNVSLFKDLKALLSLYWLIRRQKFDLVHTHSSKAGFLGRLAAVLARTPVIVHTPHGHVFYGYFGPVKTKIFIFCEQLCARFTNALIALTNQGVQEHLKFGVKAKGRMVAIPSGVDLRVYGAGLSNGSLARLHQELGIPPECCVIGTVGRLDPVKGTKYFLQAAQLLLADPGHSQKMKILVIGDGEEAADLKKWVHEKGLDPWVIFAGQRRDVSDLMNVMDVFVSSSLNEGMGRTLVQAQAAKIPVVATAVGGVQDVIRHEHTGILVPPQNPKALAHAIAKLLAGPALAKRYGENGRQWVMELCDGYPRFSQERMLHLLDKLYEELL